MLSGFLQLEQQHEKTNTEHSDLDVTAPHAVGGKRSDGPRNKTSCYLEEFSQ